MKTLTCYECKEKEFFCYDFDDYPHKCKCLRTGIVWSEEKGFPDRLPSQCPYNNKIVKTINQRRKMLR